MPDRIPQLDDLAATAKESPMLSPSEIRRRGDRRRAGRRTVGAVAVLALAVGGVTVWNSPLLDDARDPQWADQSPTTTQSPGPTPSPEQTTPVASPDATPPEIEVEPPTWASVPTAEMLREDQPEALLELRGEYEGPGQAAKGYCDPGAEAWGDPGTFLVREFGHPDDGYETYIWATVLGYPSVELAEEAYAGLRDGVARCPERIGEVGYYPDPVGHDLTDDLPFDPAWAGDRATDHAFLASVGMSPGGETPGLFNDTLIVRAGDRVLWVTGDFIGWDHNCSVAEEPDLAGQCQIPAATREMVEALVR